MNIKQILASLLIILNVSGKAQINGIKDRTVEHYFNQIADLEIVELINQKILIDSLTISPEYKDSISNRLNEEGFMKYVDIKANIYSSFFKDYLYQQKVEFGNDYYILYFTMAGFDDMQWDIIRMKKGSWNGKERLSRELVRKNDSIERILFNYDEGPKNLENIKIFINKHYLVMERGNLYHSLYDLENQMVLINEESPGYEVLGDGREEVNRWIKENLHDKIEKIINE